MATFVSLAGSLYNADHIVAVHRYKADRESDGCRIVFDCRSQEDVLIRNLSPDQVIERIDSATAYDRQIFGEAWAKGEFDAKCDIEDASTNPIPNLDPEGGSGCPAPPTPQAGT